MELLISGARWVRENLVKKMKSVVYTELAGTAKKSIDAEQYA